jgi:hypothetical protein
MSYMAKGFSNCVYVCVCTDTNGVPVLFATTLLLQVAVYPTDLLGNTHTVVTMFQIVCCTVSLLRIVVTVSLLFACCCDHISVLLPAGYIRLGQCEMDLRNYADAAAAYWRAAELSTIKSDKQKFTKKFTEAVAKGVSNSHV